MDLQEAYLTLQRASSIEVGDRVKILRMPTTGRELGWKHPGKLGSFPGTSSRRDEIGKEKTVRHIEEAAGVVLSTDLDDFTDYWPFFCLELIKKGKPPITIGDNAVEFTDNGIKVGCQEVSKETIDKIHERIHERP